MDDVDVLEKDGNVYAKCFRADCTVEKNVRFITEDEDPLQVGIFERDTGYEVEAHRHKSRNLSLPDIGEFLWIQSGSATVDVYDEQWQPLGSWTVGSGDCVVLLRGGHGLKMLEPTRILEVKQGPYPGRREDEKTFRASV